ncbi:MAG TPA: cytochrome C oxidase subunit IV family protein [Methylophilaceae bacterium]|nr:cytochrome C oxidase subunit IV family protein [Methylophilaceae bacterium]
MHTQIQPNWFSTMIWLLLVALTLTTFSIGQSGPAGSGAMLAVLLIALVKGQMVANYFMGLRRVHTGWRILILAYFLIVGGLIALAYQLA